MLVWGEGTQTDFYDQPAQVDFAVDAADAFMKGDAGVRGLVESMT